VLSVGGPYGFSGFRGPTSFFGFSENIFLRELRVAEGKKGSLRDNTAFTLIRSNSTLGFNITSCGPRLSQSRAQHLRSSARRVASKPQDLYPRRGHQQHQPQQRIDLPQDSLYNLYHHYLVAASHKQPQISHLVPSPQPPSTPPQPQPPPQPPHPPSRAPPAPPHPPTTPSSPKPFPTGHPREGPSTSTSAPCGANSCAYKLPPTRTSTRTARRPAQTGGAPRPPRP
jgi:hypothetical protein